MTTPESVIDQVEAVLDAATPGPWYWEPGDHLLGCRVGSEGHRRGVGDFALFGIEPHEPTDEWDVRDPAAPEADARAIVLTRNLMPAALAVVRAAEPVMAEWDAFGPTGTHSTLASHRALRAALAAFDHQAREAVEEES